MKSNSILCVQTDLSRVTTTNGFFPQIIYVCTDLKRVTQIRWYRIPRFFLTYSVFWSPFCISLSSSTLSVYWVRKVHQYSTVSFIILLVVFKLFLVVFSHSLINILVHIHLVCCEYIWSKFLAVEMLSERVCVFSVLLGFAWSPSKAAEPADTPVSSGWGCLLPHTSANLYSQSSSFFFF